MRFLDLFRRKPVAQKYEVSYDVADVRLDGAAECPLVVRAADAEGELRDIDFIPPGDFLRNFRLISCDHLIVEALGDNDVHLDVMVAEVRVHDKLDYSPAAITPISDYNPYHMSVQTLVANELAKRGIRDEKDVDNGSEDDYSFFDDDPLEVSRFMETEDEKEIYNHGQRSDQNSTGDVERHDQEAEAAEGESGKASSEDDGRASDVGRVADAAE